MVTTAPLALMLVVIAGPMRISADECEPLKPVKIAGVCCGRVLTTAAAPLSDIEMRLENAAGAVVATVVSDAKDGFRFPRLPKGQYVESPKAWQLRGRTIQAALPIIPSGPSYWSQRGGKNVSGKWGADQGPILSHIVLHLPGSCPP